MLFDSFILVSTIVLFLHFFIIIVIIMSYYLYLLFMLWHIRRRSCSIVLSATRFF